MRYVEPHPKSGVYRVRVPVAPHLRAMLGQTAYTRTLGTKDRPKAEKQAYAVIAEFQRLIEHAEIAHAATAAGGVTSSALVGPAAAASAIQAWTNAAKAQMTDAIWREGRDASLRNVAPELGAEGPSAFRRAYRHSVLQFLGNPNATEVVGDHEARLRALLRRVLGEAGNVLPPDGAPLSDAAFHLLHDALNLLAAEQDKLRHGEWTMASLATLPLGNIKAAPVQASGVAAPPISESTGRLAPRLRVSTLNEFLEEFFREGRAKSVSSRSELRLAVRRLLDFLGKEDVFLHEITYEDAKAFRDTLLSLPKRMNDADWKRGVRQLVKDFQEGNDTRPRLLPQTVGKPIRLLTAVMAHAVQRGRIERHVFGGLLMKGGLKARQPRKPFSPDDIATIFEAPIFTGCLSPEKWWVPGNVALRDHRYWIPLICQTMGLRLEEAGQLCVTDVQKLHGVDCLAITEREGSDDDDDDAEDMISRLKTDNSERFVPIHPLLAQLGFLEMVDDRRRGGEQRLFPELKRNKAGKLTAAVSKWFCARFLPRVGISNPAKKFHSFRHSYCDNLRNSQDIKDEVRRALMGHASTAAH